MWTEGALAQVDPAVPVMGGAVFIVKQHHGGVLTGYIPLPRVAVGEPQRFLVCVPVSVCQRVGEAHWVRDDGVLQGLTEHPALDLPLPLETPEKGEGEAEEGPAVLAAVAGEVFTRARARRRSRGGAL